MIQGLKSEIAIENQCSSDNMEGKRTLTLSDSLFCFASADEGWRFSV